MEIPTPGDEVKLLQFLKNLYWKRWIKKRGAKLAGGLESMSKRSELIIEDCVELGHVELRARHVEIGAHTYIRSGTHLSLVSSIGRFCSIASDVFIGQEKYTHPSDWVSSHPFQYTDAPLTYNARTDMTEIGHDVWIGHSAMIMEGVTVGTGAISPPARLSLKMSRPTPSSRDSLPKSFATDIRLTSSSGSWRASGGRGT